MDVTNTRVEMVLNISTVHDDNHYYHRYVERGILIPLTVLIISINGFVLYFLYVKKSFSQSAYWFLTSLTIADIFVGLISIVLLTTHAREHSLDLCLVRFGFAIAAIHASIQSLLWIAIDRYIAIMKALSYNRILTPRKRIYANIYIWFQSIFIGFLPFMGWKDDIYDSHCSFLYVLSPSYVLFLFVTAWIPILIIFIIYIILYRNAKSHIRKINTLENFGYLVRYSGPLGLSVIHLKSLKTLITITGCVVATWSPFFIATLIQLGTSDQGHYLKDVVGTYLLLLGFSNSFLNPIIYAFRTKDFREHLSTVLQGICNNRNNSR